jgi:translation initiation factor 1
VQRDDRNARRVYSTEHGRTCPRCGWPERDCKCSQAKHDPIPGRITARLRMEKTGRGGKIVTVVDGLPRNDAFLKDLCQELKRTCGTGGTVQDGAIELQGEQRERVRPLLAARGFIVKG